MNQKNNGGAAFPLKEALTSDNEGMTLRDYFAAQALPAILSQQDFGIQAYAPTSVPNPETGITAAQLWAASAYATADAMLHARGLS